MATSYCSGCSQDLPVELFYKDASRPSGASSRCKVCAKKYQSRWYRRNKQKRDAQKKEYKLKNASSIKLASKKYYERTKEHQSKMARMRYEQKREEILQKQRQRYRKEYSENPARIASKSRARQLLMADQYASSPAALKAETAAVYQFAKMFPGMEVDHIIPLRHQKVCGLHLPANLRPLAVSDNRSKSNRFMREDFEAEERRLVDHAKTLRAL